MTDYKSQIERHNSYAKNARHVQITTQNKECDNTQDIDNHFLKLQIIIVVKVILIYTIPILRKIHSGVSLITTFSSQESASKSVNESVDLIDITSPPENLCDQLDYQMESII